MNVGTYHHGDLRTALIAAGIEIVERDGIEGLSLRAAARAVGVSHAAPSRHFEDIRSFLAAIAAAGYDHLADALAMASTDDERNDPLVALRSIGGAYVEFALVHPNWYQVMFHPLLADRTDEPELADASTQAFERLRSGIERAMVAGVIRTSDVDESAVALWASVHGICALLNDGQLTDKGVDRSPRDIAALVLTTAFLGLRP